ncbi:MAG: hypothetical protein CMC70_11595 [Flavobacteriaceae bacterium]|nr:hypothetical protein [Flavobacteriaceae bacterium]
MSNYIENELPENFYIQRRKWGWNLQINIQGKPFKKHFSANKYGGVGKALKAAKKLRDELIKEHKINVKKRFNLVHPPGISKSSSVNKKTGNEQSYWQASWKENGKSVAKRFSVKKYGDKEAKEMALAYKLKMQELYDETGQTLFQKLDPNQKIWRYMDFTKFVYMLEKGGLFFPNIDMFNDPYEGAYTRANSTIRNFVFSRSKNIKKWDDLLIKSKENRKNTFVSCWHINDFESAGMWKLYAKTNESICIQTTIGKLTKALPTEVKIGKVRYIDYAKDWIPETGNYYPFLYKRFSFEHEAELRALFDKSMIENQKKFELAGNGYWIKLNMQTLIQRIYVSPEAPIWFFDLVEKIKNAYKLTLKRVYMSPLNNDPNENYIQNSNLK